MSRTLKTIVKEDVQQILDHFCYSLNIRILFYTPNGEVLSVGLNRPDSAFCRLVRKLYGERRCLTLDDEMRHESARRRELVCYTCHAGLNESVDPIYVRDVLVGYAMIGQFRSGKRIAPHVLADYRDHFAEDAPLKEAFDALPTYDAEGRNHIIGLFRLLVEYVISKDLIAVEGSLLVERVRQFVENRLRDGSRHRPMLQEVADAMDRSPSTISHAVKRHTGSSFQRLCIDARLRRAEALMTEHPELTIRDAASRAGYDDQFYFSRIYRKLRGFPPSRFRGKYEHTDVTPR